jgi:hypothetical protein
MHPFNFCKLILIQYANLEIPGTEAAPDSQMGEIFEHPKNRRYSKISLRGFNATSEK